MFPKPLVKSIWAIMCDVTGHSHWIDNVRCNMHQTRLQVKRTSRLRLKRVWNLSENKMRLKRETQGAFCVLNANAKSQKRKYMKINVICTVPILNTWNFPHKLIFLSLPVSALYVLVCYNDYVPLVNRGISLNVILIGAKGPKIG